MTTTARTAAESATPSSTRSTPQGHTEPSPGRREPAERGTLTISEKAIEKVAGQIASETPGIHGSTGGFLGIGSHHDEDARPKVKVQLHGLTASIHVKAGVRYPTPLRATTERLRSRIREQVSARCGIDVRQVDVDIVTLISDSDTTSGRRELQ